MSKTAEQIADELEKKAFEMATIAGMLRGYTKVEMHISRSRNDMFTNVAEKKS